MILLLLLLIPLVTGIAAWAISRWNEKACRWISLVGLAVNFAISIGLWITNGMGISVSGRGPWIAQFEATWIPQIGSSFFLSMDGLSLLLIVLTNYLSAMGVAASWRAITQRVGFFHFNLLALTAGMVGIFLALDMLLFYVFWEVLLVPLYFLIAIWGLERRVYAAIKFFIFTQGSGLLMLLGILGLYFVHGRSSGTYTFNYLQLLGTEMPAGVGMWLMLAFFVAFIVKLPAVPLHTWLPDAHTEAPAAGSVDLAGLVLKVGAYGLLRFAVPLFPSESSQFALAPMVLGVIGIIYGALMAFGQGDLKRLVAYTSISHMGFVLVGVYAWNELALQGVVVVMLAHGVSTGAMFILVSQLHERLGTRQFKKMGGLWAAIPRMGGVGMVLSLALLALPGLGNFVGEFLVLLGVFRSNVTIAVLASIGFVVSVVYSLWIMQRTFLGPNTHEWKLEPMLPREAVMHLILVASILWIGLNPQPILNLSRPAIEHLQQSVSASGKRGNREGLKAQAGESASSSSVREIAGGRP